MGEHALFDVRPFAENVALLIETLGIGVIAIAALVSLGRFTYAALRERSFERPYEVCRRQLGRGILLGLELLVAADIIATVVVELNLTTVSVLGLIVLIRTFLSFSLEAELDGRWPWQAHEQGEAQA